MRGKIVSRSTEERISLYSQNYIYELLNLLKLMVNLANLNEIRLDQIGKEVFHALITCLVRSKFSCQGGNYEILGWILGITRTEIPPVSNIPERVQEDKWKTYFHIHEIPGGVQAVHLVLVQMPIGSIKCTLVIVIFPFRFDYHPALVKNPLNRQVPHQQQYHWVGGQTQEQINHSITCDTTPRMQH